MMVDAITQIETCVSYCVSNNPQEGVRGRAPRAPTRAHDERPPFFAQPRVSHAWERLASIAQVTVVRAEVRKLHVLKTVTFERLDGQNRPVASDLAMAV